MKTKEKFPEPVVFVQNNILTLYQDEERQIYIKPQHIPDLLKNISEALIFMGDEKVKETRKRLKPKLNLVVKS